MLTQRQRPVKGDLMLDSSPIKLSAAPGRAELPPPLGQ